MVTVDDDHVSTLRGLLTSLASKLDPDGRVELSELESIAYIELANAASVFEGRPENFTPYAHRRVATAIRRHLRPTPLPKSGLVQGGPKLKPICYRVGLTVVKPNDMRWAVSRLPERARIVVCGIYDDEARNVEIAASLGLTEGRVCQLHDEAIERLRLLLSIRCSTSRPEWKPRVKIGRPQSAPTSH